MTNVNTADLISGVDHAAAMNDRWLFVASLVVFGLFAWIVMRYFVLQHERLIEATHEACKEAGADRVISSVLRKKPSGEVESLRAIDSEGVLEWLTS